MLNEVSLQDLRFYKKEIHRIKEQAVKRHGFFNKLQQTVSEAVTIHYRYSFFRFFH